MKLTLYLFRESVASFEHCLKPQTETRKYRDITNQENDAVTESHRILMLDKEPKVPEWANFFGNYVQSDVYGKLESSAPATIILFKVADGDGQRIMAATNGSAYSLIDGGLVEKDFGLKVTLNSIVPSQIKSLEYKNMQARRLQRRESAASATSIANFGFAYNNELIKSISGRAQDEELGRTITGSTSLKISMPDLHITQLKIVGEQALNRYQQTRYREHFDFIDHVMPVEDPSLVAELDAELIEQLHKPVPLPSLSVSHSNQAQYTQSEYLQVTVRGVKERFDEIDITGLHRFIRDNAGELDVDTLKKEAYMFGYSADEKPITRKVNLYKLLSCGVSRDDIRYSLHDGSWYAVQSNYLGESQTSLGLQTKQAANKVPSWSSDTPEQHFASDLNGDWQDLSREWLNPRGRGRIFAADAFYTPASALVAFSRTNSAVSLEYLVDRAVTAAELIRDADPKMIDFLTQTTKLFAKTKDRDDAINSLQFVFAVGFKNDMTEELSAFDIMALARGLKTLRRLGFKASIQPIQLS